MKTSRNNVTALMTVLVLSLVLLGILFYTSQAQNDNTLRTSKPGPDGMYRMVLEDNGYDPQELVIPKGSTVIFSTNRGRHHWPASNMHPNHGIYSEFDPKEPVAPEETWRFTFNRVGKWNLHDHLRSYYRGTITVIEESEE